VADLPSQIIKVIRPLHWIKNLSLFAALIFTGGLYNPDLFIKVIWAFIAFNLASSATYVFNDILDAKIDVLHPIKRNRPIASGKLSIPVATALSLVLALGALYLSVNLNSLFFFMILTYLILQVLYSLGLKKVAIIDILIIAFGFIMRVYAGAFVINAHLSVWFLLCVISVALFLASGKRRAELNVIQKTTIVTRESLTHYDTELLNSYVTMFGNAAWLSWSLFSFFESPTTSTPVWLLLSEISKTTTINKMMMITIPIVIFGIMRYQHLIFTGRSEAPEKVLLTDKGLTVSALLWLGLVVFVLYGGVATDF
jgi:decaprenyl-phosphate phosphoribosyltransferase